jgi:hypothetical protein
MIATRSGPSSSSSRESSSLSAMPFGEHHVLRRTAGVEARRPLGPDHNRDGERGGAYVGGREDALRRVVPEALEDDEAPGLAVLRAARNATGVEDASNDFLRQTPVGVVADLSLADDGQIRVHGSSAYRARQRVTHGEAASARAVASVTTRAWPTVV